ncbi:hypothetical protein LJ737_19945 [Hymenobacter sp. 15J16-1T3B]|uniref:hypothetical protein n=1 Tax=Hymenobacter sp. 15J16-1T3B TaxID=2886941 RepID=UPI001D103F3C|nr:hypothetical protein [Hymenobacter sp. 15J16-1T3B]MCC3159525.1 hypothetical protein [Hymenobacter sp. 15J16-1T3B]
MPLNKPALKAAILRILSDMTTRTSNQAQAREDAAEQLATAIDTYVRTGTVTTTGSATTQTGTIS